MYQWFWRSGIFMQLGAGPVYVTNPNINIFSNNNETIDWDFTLGYAF
jgi:hypothetical protein